MSRIVDVARSDVDSLGPRWRYVVDVEGEDTVQVFTNRAVACRRYQQLALEPATLGCGWLDRFPGGRHP